MANRTRTDFIAVHCSATRPSMNVTVDDIRKWHKAKGWVDVGYQYVITRAGVIQPGRPLNAIGAHVEGYNARSVGICLVGGVSEADFTKPENNFTPAQFRALKGLIADLKTRYPAAVVQGHRDFPGVKKACPSFDVRAWLKKVGL